MRAREQGVLVEQEQPQEAGGSDDLVFVGGRLKAITEITDHVTEEFLGVHPDTLTRPTLALAATGMWGRDRRVKAPALHVLPSLGGLPLNAVRESTVRRWRSDLLGSGVGAPTVAKAYRLLGAVMYTAVDDDLIRRNPCRMKRAGDDTAPRTPHPEHPRGVRHGAIGRRYRALVYSGPSRACGWANWPRCGERTSTWRQPS